MQRIRGYFQNFYRSGGIHILSSSLLVKIVMFLLTVFIVRLLNKDDYGVFNYSRSIISFILPFAGFGVFSSLLRYGSIVQGFSEKVQLYKYSIKYGIIFSAILWLLLIVFAIPLTNKIPGSYIVVVIFGITIITNSTLQSTKNFYRLLNLNKTYSYISTAYALLLFVTAIVFSYFGGVVGYSVSFVLSMLIISLYYNVPISKFVWSKSKLKSCLPKSIKIKEFWEYGLYSGIGSIVSELIYSIDILFLGYILTSSDLIADYKVATVLPYNLLIFPMALMTTDFVRISKGYNDRLFLKRYYKKLQFILIPSGIIIIGSVYLISGFLIELIFGYEYRDSYTYQQILLVGVLFNFVLRLPLGNVLMAVGKANWNVMNALITLVINACLNIILIREYSVIGAAYATTISMIISSFISLFLFSKYLKGLNNNG